MRALLFGVALTVLALALAATATGGPDRQAQSGSCAKANLNLIEDGRLTLGTDNPAFPPWWGGGETRRPWKVSNPYSGRGYESAVAYAVARQLGFSKNQVDWRAVPFAQSYRPGDKPFDFYMAQVSFTPARERAVDFSNAYYYVNQALVGRAGTPIASASTRAELRPYTSRRAARDDELPVHRRPHPAELATARLRHERPRHSGAQERPDRRDRRRSSDCVHRHGRTGGRRRDCRPVPEPRQPGAPRDGVRAGQLAQALREPRAQPALGERDDERDQDPLALEGRRRAGHQVVRRWRATAGLGS